MIAALAMATATGCGGGDAAVETVTVTETVETTSGGGAAACREAVGALLQAEQDLWARLRVGVAYADYVKEVGDLSVADSRIAPINDPKCAEVRGQLRGAILWYKRASEGWLCTGSGCHRWRTKRQIRWQEAHMRVERAEQLLAAMG